MARKKVSKKKRSGSSVKRKSQGGAWFFRIRTVFGMAVLLGVLAAGIVVTTLNLQVRAQFEGKKWSLPARVFARPLELYPGLGLSAVQLVKELELLNYQAGTVDGQGSYRAGQNRVDLHVRDFQFWDERADGKRLRVLFDEAGVAGISEFGTGRALSLLRIDPMQIASIYPGHHEDRDLIKLGQVPPLLIRTLLAVEDKDYYEHSGIKLVSITRAMLANIRAGATVQGGSTLTQQLVKNFYLNNERTLQRKIQEALMALLLEQHYSKDVILETYLNEIYLGQDGERAIHGFALASQHYFGQPLLHLQPEQIAMLVAIVKGPSYYDPKRHPERVRERRNRVLSIMQRENLIAAKARVAGQRAALGIREARDSLSPYPAFVDLVRRQLQRDYRDEDLRTEGLRVFTTLDPLLQFTVQQVLQVRLAELEKAQGLPRNSLQGAVVLTDTQSGEVLVLAGDRNPAGAGFNRALNADRAIGSLIKPVIYLEALSHTSLYNPVSRLDDSAFSFRDNGGKVWRPENYDHVFHGSVPLYQGLVQSYNAATARLGMALGVDSVLQRLAALGLDKSIEPYPSVLLGAVSLSPLEVAQVYQTFAASGFIIPLRAVREVLTAEGQVVQRYPLNVRQTDDPEAVYILNSLLRDVVQSGTAQQAGAQLPALKAAGKTGTSNDLRDSWFAGFTGSHLAVVWLGRDDNKPIKLTGAMGALPVWIDILSRIQTRPLQLNQPAGVEWVGLDAVSGNRSNGKCEKEVQLPFIMGTAPDRLADCRSRSFWQRLFD